MTLIVALAISDSRAFSGVVPIDPRDFGAQIATAPDGRHALVYWEYGEWFKPLPSVMVWADDPANAQIIPLPDWYSTWVPNVEFLGADRFVIADADMYSGGGFRVAEYRFDGASLIPISTNMVGDWSQRWGASCRLASGGLFFVNYRHTGPNIEFYTAYRRPYPQPPNPNASAVLQPDWQIKFWSLPVDIGEIASSNWAVVQGSDGLIRIWVSRDSSALIRMATCKETSAGHDMVGFNQNFLSAQTHNAQLIDGLMSPHGELPAIVARWDRWHNRTVLHYARWDFKYTCSGNYFARTATTAVYNDGRKELIEAADYWVERISQPLAWVRPDGVYAMDLQTDLATCQTTRKLAPSVNGKQVEAGFVASSEDGWIAYHGEGGFHVERLQFPALVSVAKAEGVLSRSQVLAMARQVQETDAQFLPVPSSLRISWDQPGTLEENSDGAWHPVDGARSPFVVPMNLDWQYFRVKQ